MQGEIKPGNVQLICRLSLDLHLSGPGMVEAPEEMPQVQPFVREKAEAQSTILTWS